MWRAANKSSYRKKMSYLDNSYSYRGKGRKTCLTSWENNSKKRDPQQKNKPLMNNRREMGYRLKLRH